MSADYTTPNTLVYETITVDSEYRFYRKHVQEFVVWKQLTPSAVWTIPHNLKHEPAVIVKIDGTTEAVSPIRTDPNINTTVLTFGAPESGEVTLI